MDVVPNTNYSWYNIESLVLERESSEINSDLFNVLEGNTSASFAR